MIIDFHVHCFPDELAEKAIPLLANRAGLTPYTDGTASGVKRSMKAAGIDISVILPIATKPSQTQKLNDWAEGIQDENIISFGSIHPDFPNADEELFRIKEKGLKGIKFHPDYQCFYVDEPRMLRLYEKAFELDLILIFHAGIDIGLKPPYHCTPDRMLNVLKSLPGGRIIASHMGGYSYWDDVEHLLVGENIYLDTSYILGVMDNTQLKRIIANHGADKILFATDSPWTDQKDQVKKLKSLKLDTDAEAAIISGNAFQLLKLENKQNERNV